MPFFSIIVPVYNVEKYLNNCIVSILNQDFNDYEIILVDDGSTDGSSKICDDLSDKNESIIVIHKSNGGLSDARNAGLTCASGKYILFVDSDDMIKKNSLNSIYNVIEKNKCPDVVFLEAVKFYPDGRKEPMGDGYKEEMINGASKIEVLKFVSAMNKFPGSACTKAVKKKIMLHDLEFEVGLLSEDIEWTYRLLQKAETFAYCPNEYYLYRQQREGSITYAVSEKKIESLFWTIEKWAKKNPKDEMEEIIDAYVAYQYVIMLFNVSCMKKNKGLYYTKASRLRWILKFGRNKKCRMVYYVSCVLGMRLTGTLLKKYKMKIKG